MSNNTNFGVFQLKDIRHVSYIQSNKMHTEIRKMYAETLKMYTKTLKMYTKTLKVYTVYKNQINVCRNTKNVYRNERNVCSGTYIIYYNIIIIKNKINKEKANISIDILAKKKKEKRARDNSSFLLSYKAALSHTNTTLLRLKKRCGQCPH